jgi:two-component system cell cycle sensor histidine kinase/response regulator CckA
MKQSAHRMAHLTSQLLAYARGGKYNPQPMSLSNFVEGALPIIQHILDPDIRVETDLPLDIMDVNIDRTQMQMVLSAIVANSNEAIDPPGRIRISTRNMDIDQEFIKDHPGLTPGSYVCLSIEDDGKGMDEETRNRIFDPFFTTHFMGRGLGMASVYGIIKNHDGTTTVDSEIGKGTVVRIYLPAIEAEEEVEEKVVPEPKVELAGGEGTVLVIEDEAPLVKLFRQILERLGYRVLEAKTGEEAVELAKTFDGQIDLALLDIKLPDMDGGRVYPLIMEARPDLKVIVCSGYSIDGPAQAILDAGAEGFIQKPFLIAPFAEKLKEVLGGK